MLKRDYDGPPIDATQQYVSERNETGETVAGTTDDDFREETTEAWPSGLDRDEFTNMQADVVRALVLSPEASQSTIGDAVGCTSETVRQVKHKISAMNKAGAVPFEVPDQPNPNIKIVQKYIGDTSVRGQDESEDTDVTKEEIYSMLNDGYEVADVAEELQISVNRVAGMKGHLASWDDPKEAERNQEKPAAEPAKKTQQTNNDSITVEFEREELLDIFESEDINRDIKNRLLSKVI